MLPLFLLIILSLTAVNESKSIDFIKHLKRSKRSINETYGGVEERIHKFENTSRDEKNSSFSIFEKCTDTAHDSTFLRKTISRIQQNQPDDLTLYWKIEPNNVSITNQFSIVKMAFRLWSEATPLKFRDSQKNEADIFIEFKEGDSRSGVTFRNESPVIIVSYRDRADQNEETVAIIQAITHSLGHVFGLEHNKMKNSIMYPMHTAENELFLGSYVEKEVRKVLGPCRAKFNFVVDTVNGTRVKTRFFSDDTQWYYHHPAQSSIFGGVEIGAIFPLLPKPLDTMLYIYDERNGTTLIDAYGFQGETIYTLNASDLSPLKTFSWHDFECEHKATSINNALFMNHLIFLFNDTHVWEYDLDAFVHLKCPRRFGTFQQFFLTNYQEEFSTGIDHIYFSYMHNVLFFFKNDELYMEESLNWSEISDIYTMELSHKGKWYEIFQDVCNTDPWEGFSFKDASFEM